MAWVGKWFGSFYIILITVTNIIVCCVESLESACITIVSVAESIALVGSSSSITDGWVQCYPLCKNVYACYKYSSGDEEGQNQWAAQSQHIVQLWRWVCGEVSV